MKQIMVVDDDSLVRKSLCRGFRLHGYASVGFANAKNALEHLAQNKVDVVICDLFMPEMDGLEFLAELQKMPSNPKTIMISGGSSELGIPPNKYLKMTRTFGAAAVLKKPFSLSELLVLVEFDDVQGCWNHTEHCEVDR